MAELKPQDARLFRLNDQRGAPPLRYTKCMKVLEVIKRLEADGWYRVKGRGGHLSLMQGTAGDLGDAKAKDPIDRASSRVQAVACFFPPTDFLNYGEKGKVALGCGTLENFKPPFDFLEQDKITRSFNLVQDETRRREIGKQISPFYHAGKDSAPTRIIHGDADKLVPIQQAEIMIARLKEAGVPADLVVKKGAGHGWAQMDKDIPILADWFDQYLLKSAGRPGEATLQPREKQGKEN